MRDVTVGMGDGEIVGLLGANGAGKSTLCLVLAGLAPRVLGGTLAGRVLLEGADARDHPMHQVARRVGAVFQDPATQLSGIASTVYEEVAFGPSNLGLPLSEVVERTESALEAAGIADLAARTPARLSGGQQQLVAIAGVLAMRPGHLVLDEPTARLDARSVTLVADALERLAEQGVSILLAEHRTELVASVCGRVVVLRGGSIVLDAPMRAALADERLRELGVAEPPAARLARLTGRARTGGAAT
ncbi:MAG: energy-coupling factor ABC transporter ATP-binding protein [Candidatus Limnocylindria bacterium]